MNIDSNTVAASGVWSGTIGELNVTGSADFSLEGGNSPIVSAVANQGTITVLGTLATGFAVLDIDTSSPVMLTGGGEVVLTDATQSLIGNGSVGEVLINVDNTISGQGTIHAQVINQSTSTIRAEGGTLTFHKELDNTAGSVEVAADGRLTLNQGMVGGTLDADPLGEVSGRLEDVTLVAALPVQGGLFVTLENTFTNPGVVTVLGSLATGFATLDLDTSGPVTLSGGGEVVLTDATRSLIGNGSVGEILINVDNTIRGQGDIFAQVTNQSTIRAEGGTLRFQKEVDNMAGVVEVAADGKLTLNQGLVGGLLDADPLGEVSGRLVDVTSGAALPVQGGLFVTLENTFTNPGTITVLGSLVTGFATLDLDTSGPVTLSGGGEVVLTDATHSLIGNGNPGEILINVDNTIHGQGDIFAQVTNQSTVRAEGGTLRFQKEVDNTAGVVEVAADGKLTLSQALVGGLLDVDPLGEVSGRLEDVTSGAALSVHGGLIVTLENTFTNPGVVSVLGSGLTGFAVLDLDTSGPVTLSGGGEVVLTDATRSLLGNGSPSEVLINVDNTIRGQGDIHAKLINQDTVAPGLSAGLLNIIDDFEQTATGVLEMEIGGLLGGDEFDVLAITGSAMLDGALDLSLIDPFIPMLGDTFTILTATGGVTGTFNTVNAPTFNGIFTFDVTYNANDVVLEVIAQILLGDANNDGQVTGADLISVQQNFGNVGAVPLQGDANNDGQVTGADLISVQQNFGNVLTPASSSVPEPGTLGGCALCLVAGLWRLRRVE